MHDRKIIFQAGNSLRGMLLVVMLSLLTSRASEATTPAGVRPPDFQTESEATGGVPAPRRINTGPYQVGAILCPLWKGGKPWSHIEPYPDRKPLLGWYDEGNPEVTDWEIKWAIDHGISFFSVCWYRGTGNFDEPEVRPGLEHWLREGLFNSRYGDQIKFTVIYVNQLQTKEYDGRTSERDFLDKLVPFWIRNYFSRGNYLTIDGKPVFSIYNPEKFVREVGGEERAIAVLDKMRVACKEAGFKGVYVLGHACWGSPKQLKEQAERIARIGMDANWAYHWPTFAQAFGRNLWPTGEQAIAAQEKLWQTQPQPNLVTLSMGWDSRPWGSSHSKAQWRLTPGEFEELCRRAKAVLDTRTPDNIAGRLVLLDSWNEFGEGHYVEPTQEYGFGYLDAVRKVFAAGAEPHSDLRPSPSRVKSYEAGFRAWKEHSLNAEEPARKPNPN